MIQQILGVAGVIFLLVICWVGINAVARKWRSTEPGEECGLPEQECSHCLMMDQCAMRLDREDTGSNSPEKMK